MHNPDSYYCSDQALYWIGLYNKRSLEYAMTCIDINHTNATLNAPLKYINHKIFKEALCFITLWLQQRDVARQPLIAANG